MKRALSFLLILCLCVGVCATAISCDSQSTPKETETQAEQKPIETSTGTTTEEKTESESVETTEAAKVETTEESKVETTEESKVETTEEPKVETTEESKVETTEEPKVETTEEPKVETTEEPKVETTEESKVETTEESKVETTETTEETTEEVTEAAPENTVEKSEWESLFTADNLTLYYTDGSVSNFYSFDGGMLYIYSEYMGEGAGMYIDKAEGGYWFTEEVYFEGNWITSFDESEMLGAMYLARDIFFNALGNCYDSFTYDESSKAYLANNIQVGDEYEEFNLTDVCVKIENGKISTVNFKWEEFDVAINDIGTTSVVIPTVDFTVTEEEWDAIWSGDDFINVEIRYMEDYGSIIDRTVQNENTLIDLLCTENAICANYDTYVIKKDGVWYEVIMSEDGYVGTAVTDEYVYENYLIYGTFSVDFLNAYNSFTYDEANECYVGEWCDQECRIYFANGKVAFVEVISASGEKGAYMFCWYGQVTEEELYLPEFKIDGTDDEEEDDSEVESDAGLTVTEEEWREIFSGRDFDNFQMTSVYGKVNIQNGVVGDYIKSYDLFIAEDIACVSLANGIVTDLIIMRDGVWYNVYFINDEYIAVDITEEEAKENSTIGLEMFADYYSLFVFDSEKVCYVSDMLGWEVYFSQGKLLAIVMESSDITVTRIFHNYGKVESKDINIPEFVIADKGNIDAETWWDKTLYWHFENSTMDYVVEFKSGYEEPVVSGNVKFTYNGCIHNGVLASEEEKEELYDGMLNMVLSGCRDRKNFIYDSENNCYFSIQSEASYWTYGEGEARIRFNSIYITFDDENNVKSISANIYNEYITEEGERVFEMQVTLEFSNYGTTVIG